MRNYPVLCFFLVALTGLSCTANIFDLFKELVERLGILNSELYDVDTLGNKFYVLAQENQQYLAELATLPDQIADINTMGNKFYDLANNNQQYLAELARLPAEINQAMPVIQSCAIILGVSIIGAALICTAPKIAAYFEHKKKRALLLEDVHVIND
jgi:hypothetical protein